jgi:hypothetical protein
MKKLAVLLLFIFSVLLYLAVSYSFLLWDENAYLGNARSHIGVSRYTEDFRFPLLEYLIAFVWLFTGESVLAARILAIAFSIGAIFISYLLFKQYFKEKLVLSPLILTVFLATNILILYWGFRVYPDIAGLFFMMLSAYLVLKKKPAPAGIAATLAFLARFPNALFGISAGIYYLAKRDIKSALVFSLGAIATAFPWLIYNLLVYGNPFWDLADMFVKVGEYTYWEPVSLQLLNLLRVMNVFVLLLPFGIYFMWKDRKKKINYLLLTYAFFFVAYYFLLVNLKLDRYLIGILPFFYLIGYYGLVRIKKHRHLIMLLLLFHIIFSAWGLTSQLRNLECAEGGAISLAVDYLKDLPYENKTVISNSWPWFGYLLNANISSTWTSDIDFLIDWYGQSYFVIIEQGGLEFDISVLEQSDRVVFLKSIEDGCGHRAYIYETSH